MSDVRTLTTMQSLNISLEAMIEMLAAWIATLVTRKIQEARVRGIDVFRDWLLRQLSYIWLLYPADVCGRSSALTGITSANTSLSIVSSWARI